MKALNVWLEEYSESHQHGVNKAIHKICVPVIYFTIVGAAYAVNLWLAIAVLAFVTGFYARLSIPVAVGMAVWTGLCIAFASVLPNSLIMYAVIFVLAWIGQFYGHHVEGKKPSFFKDLQFLLIGPVWVLYSAMGKKIS